jgi:hypothetical protein
MNLLGERIDLEQVEHLVPQHGQLPEALDQGDGWRLHRTGRIQRGDKVSQGALQNQFAFIHQFSIGADGCHFVFRNQLA